MAGDRGGPDQGVTPRLSRRGLLGWGAVAGAGALVARPDSASATAGALPGPAPGPTNPPGPVPTLLPFPQQADLNFQTLFQISESAYGAGELGEVSAMVELVQQQIESGGPDTLPAFQQYVDALHALGATLADEAAAALTAGHRASARSRYLRSASYYSAALFFVLGTDSPSSEESVYDAMQASWHAAATLMEPVYQRLLIPAAVRFPDPAGGPATTRQLDLPAYFVRAPGVGPKRTVIINNGSDAQFIDVFAYGAAAAVERGYNALIFEGPGQGSMLFKDDIPFTPYWADVITALVDHLVTQPEVDPTRLALTGWSFGGLLVFRAAASEHRLAAVVGDPGYHDNGAPWSRLPPNNDEWRGYYDGLPVDGTIAADGTGDEGQRAMRFLIGKRGEIYDPQLRARALSGQMNYDIETFLDLVASYDADETVFAQVTANALVASYQDDQFFDQAQSQQVHDWLVNAKSRTLYQFTAAHGAQLHCAPMAPQFRNEIVFDWLDDVLDGSPLPPLPPPPAPVTPAPPAPAPAPVSPPAPTSAGGAASALPKTGADPGGVALAGVGLLAAGVAARRVGRSPTS